ncbi:FtsK/SpoIIIE family DNA translocase [Paenibacillus flagellatus]|uniref:Cell division protein FtsK n=1 Tax=Paenibacillus flagellatus TaxID=2211139 RepID=A0A2V5JVD2_9BACL|nr:DNA translocase FtsK [Paenibacillus flagellatus]PYI50431.1 cell division protein FtsK [Paenibacillus flagellatus]
MAKRRKKSGSLSSQLKYELYGILILIFAVIALSHEGSVARSLMYLFRFFLGVFDWVIPVIFIYIGLYVMIRRGWPRGWTARRSGFLLVVLGFLIMNHITMFQLLDPNGEWTSASWIIGQTWSSLLDGLSPQNKAVLSNQVGGGMIGAVLYACLFFLFDNLGARLIEYSLFAIGFVLITGISYVDMGSKVKRLFRGGGGRLRDTLSDMFQLMKSPQKPKPVRTRKATQPQIPIDDDFEDELAGPVVMREKKKPVFFQMLQKKQAASAAPAGDDDAEAEEIVYSSPGKDAAPSANSRSFDDDDDDRDTDSAIPLIRDFQENVVEQEQPDEPPAPPAQALPQPQPSFQAPANQMKIKLPVDGDGDVEVTFAQERERPPAKPYVLPSFSLLNKPGNSGKGGDAVDYKTIARKLETTLESFGVRTKVLEVVRGPSVTRYEIQPDVGVKVSRVVSLTDDIALALAAKDIRMEAPIPGKSAIGIEVPNSEVAVVTMREVMESPVFQESSSKLSIAFGRDISGQAIVGNLAKMPHLLVAGATGSGKSVCINGIITSILYKAKPDEVKFLMIDPKMVELNMYNGIPHLLAPVVTDPRRASLALKKIVGEMEKRYELFSKFSTRNIEGYNSMIAEKQDGEPLPYIVVILDELADLMMVAANDVEDSICRLAQKARAAGIHLIIATQRPSVDVITGLIKANIPSRIAFGVSSQVDSRTILDMVGAEKLLGRGDMLFMPVGASKPIRVQGAFLSDQEVEAVVNFCKTQEEAVYQEELVPEVEEQSEEEDAFEDELYDQAVQIVLEAKQASVSLLQRRMRVGYTRAARLIDSMEAKGIVGPYEGSKPREVLVSLEQYQHSRIPS